MIKKSVSGYLLRKVDEVKNNLFLPPVKDESGYSLCSKKRSKIQKKKGKRKKWKKQKPKPLLMLRHSQAMTKMHAPSPSRQPNAHQKGIPWERETLTYNTTKSQILFEDYAI